MKTDWTKILSILFSDLLLPFIVSFMVAKISYKWDEKKKEKDVLPRLRMILLDSKEKLKTNQNTIKAYNGIIKISVKKNESVGEFADSRIQMKFQKIDYKELEQSVGRGRILFMGFDKVDKKTLILQHIEYDEKNKFCKIDGNVVPVCNDETNNYCLIFNADDAPVALRGQVDGRSVRFAVKLCDNVELPEITKRRK